jgi:hypothetical protein
MPTLPRVLLASLLALAGVGAAAQSLPVTVDIAGNTAHARIGLANNPSAELILNFDDATGLSAASLGISAELVNLQDPSLLSRLPDAGLTSIPSAFPVLITIEPPLLGGLSFRRVVTAEIHTHLLEYSAGTPYRVFKAPLDGDFRDITRDVLPGSVRARTSTGSFSQFLILADLRPSGVVIEEKLDWLHGQIATLASDDSASLGSQLDVVEAALADGRFADAVGQLDSFSAHVSAKAGVSIPEQWSATRDRYNFAGELLSGAATLKFSIAVLRDYGI